MKVDEVMTQNVAVCFPEEPLSAAISRMASEGLGSLVVVADDDQRRVLGMLTERDLCTGLAEHGARLPELPVRKLMTTPVHCCRPDDGLWELVAMAETYRVRRFPVRGQDGRLLGMVSTSDLAREAARRHRSIPVLSPHEVCRAIAVCRSNRRARSAPPAPSGVPAAAGPLRAP